MSRKQKLAEAHKIVTKARANLAKWKENKE